MPKIMVFCLNKNPSTQLFTHFPNNQGNHRFNLPNNTNLGNHLYENNTPSIQPANEFVFSYNCTENE